MRRKNPDVKIVNGYEIKPEANLRGVFFEPETDLRGANLEGSKLTGVWMQGVHLQGAHLERASLVEAHLEGAHLENAHLEGADLSEAHLENAHLEGAHLENAHLEGAHLENAHLEGAHLENALLHYSHLSGADFTDANLSGANLATTDLSNAILTGAILEGAKIYEDTKFPAGYDIKKYFPKYFMRADFHNADLRNADFRDAQLQRARLDGAHLEGAHLEGADLSNADLEGANLKGAHLEGARLYKAYLDQTDFTNADLSWVSIGRTDLSRAILTGAILEGAVCTADTQFPKDFDFRRLTAIYDRRSYGEMTGSVLKLGKPDSPQRAADFKRKYPFEFERLIKDTGGKDFTDSVKESIRNKYRTPFDWYITRGKYRSDKQRKSAKPNDVIMLNIDLEKIDANEKQIELIKKLAEVSRRSGHPHAKNPLFTMGWIRFDVDESHKLYLVEEVQSDVQVVRQQTKDDKAQNQFRRAGIAPKDFDTLFETLRPYADRFYEDALGILFMEAEEKGYSVEMLGYGDKKDFKSPRSIYTDLPRKMGMRPQPTQTDLSLKDKVSYYKPNPSRPRRRY